jgi:hypothetical protein
MIMSKKIKKSFFFNLLTISLSLEAISIALLVPQAQAQNADETEISIIFNQPLNNNIVPPEAGAPHTTAGGASRGTWCTENVSDVQAPSSLNSYLTPLLPSNQKGLTLQERPTLFVYVPQSNATKAFFSIKDDQGNDHYQSFLDIATVEHSAIMAIPYPEDAPSLKANQDYKWSFVVLCDNRLRPDSPLVEGSIKRINLEEQNSLKQQLEQANTDLEKAKIYANAGIWYETINILANLQKSNPDNSSLNTAWVNLLNSVGLNEISEAELL